MTRNIIFSEEYLRDGCCLHFVSNVIESFLAETDFSSLLLKVSLPVFPRCFLIFA